MRLSDLKPGEEAVIIRLHGYGAFRKRVMEMGFVKGHRIEAVLTAPLNDPIKYRLMGYEISLRRNEAKMIEVATPDEFSSEFADTTTTHVTREPIISDDESGNQAGNKIHSKTHTINVALVGNPNCGKTSLFNIASGAMEHVGNYSGVTVDSKTGTFRHGGYRFNIVDLPGTYSLTSYSPEELYVRRYLRNQSPDVIINVVDASNLERNLFLTTELIDMDRSMVVALNMYDELRSSGDTLDYTMLGKMIGVPIIPTVSSTGEGIDNLFDAVIHVFEQKHPSVRHIHVNLGAELENAVREIKDIIKSDNSVERHFSPRYLAIKFLEHDSEIEELLRHTECYCTLKSARDRLIRQLQYDTSEEDISAIIANEKYGFISGALAEVMERSEREHTESSKIIDTFVTNRLFGFPIFIAVMLFILWATFYVGAYPQEWIESIVGWCGSIVSGYMPDGPLKDLIADGIIGGVGGVIVFLPNILILYFFISFMEDSGYMARAAFIMDRIMHHIGLHGKSFIPLLMGFGCNVPAIMATRAIESKSSRLITILINPFMSCSARLPLYVLLIGTFFEPYAATVFLLIYAVGIGVAVLTARLLRRASFFADETPFVMELPPYRIPTLKATWRHMWSKCKQYLQKMGGIILFASIVVWALNYFPHHENTPLVPEDTSEYIENANNGLIDTEHDSYLEMIGKAVNPVFRPLGFSWRATVAAVAGIPAKEIIVSTLGVLYTGDEEVEQHTLGQRLTTPSPLTGQPDFTPASALAFLIFVLLYCPCIATLTAIARETGSWKYVCFSVVYNTVVAWIIAFVVFSVASLFM